MSIFISYRRGPTQDIVGRIRDHLTQVYEDVFQDLGSISAGTDFEARTAAALKRANVVLAVIGPDWVSAGNLHSPNDWIRREIEPALARSDVVVIPVLVLGTELPKPEELPAGLHPLLRRQAVTVDSGIDFGHHMQRLVEAVAPYIPDPPWRHRRLRNYALFGGAFAVATGAVGWAAWSNRDTSEQASTSELKAAPSREPEPSSSSEPKVGGSDDPPATTEPEPGEATPQGEPATPRIKQPPPPPACAQGDTDETPCDTCGTKKRTCSPGGAWGSWGACEYDECKPGDSRTVSCGRCGKRTDHCTSTCRWSEGTCSGQGVCTAGETRACGNTHATCTQGRSTCNAQCQWGPCVGAGCKSFAVNTDKPDHRCGPHMFETSICNVDIRATCPAGSEPTGTCSPVVNFGGRGKCQLVGPVSKNARTATARVRIEVGPTEGTGCRIDQCYCKYTTP